MVPLPSTLEKFTHGQKQSVLVSSEYAEFRERLEGPPVVGTVMN